MTVTDPANADLPRLAKPGEVRGFTAPTALVENYQAAAKIALENPGQAVIAEAYPWGIEGEATEEVTAQAAEAARRSAQAVTKVQLPALNEWDRAEGHEGASERFHVGYSNNAEQQAALTYVVFYADGRPKRQVGAKGDEAAAAE